MLDLLGLSQVILLQQRLADFKFAKMQLQSQKEEAADRAASLPDARVEQRSAVKQFLLTALAGLNAKIKQLEAADTTLNAKIQMAQGHLQEARSMMQQSQGQGQGA